MGTILPSSSRKVRLDDLVPDLLYGDLPPELLLRFHTDSTLSSPAHSGTETATFQNGIGTGAKGWNGMGTSDGKPVKLKSLPEQNGTGTSERKLRRKRPHTVTGTHTWNGIEPDKQNGIQLNTTGLHVRSYYTSEEEEEWVKRESGTSRMVS